MDWKEEAVRYLHQSLHPVKTELNELDWKSGLSVHSIFQHSPTRPEVALLHSVSTTMPLFSHHLMSRPKISSRR